jgi:hypothetical protein
LLLQEILYNFSSFIGTPMWRRRGGGVVDDCSSSSLLAFPLSSK